MTQRSTYPDGVVVRQRDLAYTESTKSAEIRNTRIDAFGTSGGRLIGLAVTPDAANPGAVQVTLGRAFTPSGEVPELTATQTNVGMAVNNDLNLVTLAYTEEETTTALHETDGTTRSVRTEPRANVHVYTPAEYAALPATSADFAQVAQDRVAILAEVSAAGASVAIPASSITQEDVGSVRMGIRAGDLAQLPGVEFVSTDVTTEGTGSLTLTASSRSGDASDRRAFTLAFTAPGDSAGSAVSVSGAAEVTLTSNNGDALVVFVEEAFLPQGSGSTTLEFARFYEASNGDSVSAQDHTHRRQFGSAGINTANPHGQQLLDFASTVMRGLPLSAIQAAARGITDLSPADRPNLSTRGGQHGASVNPVWDLHYEALQPNNAGAALRIYLRSATAPPAGGAACITLNARYSSEVGPAWTADDTSVGAQRLVLGASDSLVATNTNALRVDFADSSVTSASWAEADWTSNNFSLIEGIASARQLRQTADSIETEAASGTAEYLLLAEFGANAGGLTRTTVSYDNPALRLYLRYTNFSSTWILDQLNITYNARWTGTEWAPDSTTATNGAATAPLGAFQLSVSTVGAIGGSTTPLPTIELTYNNSGTNFADNAWSTLYTLEGPTGRIFTAGVNDNIKLPLAHAARGADWGGGGGILVHLPQTPSGVTAADGSFYLALPTGAAYTVNSFDLVLTISDTDPSTTDQGQFEVNFIRYAGNATTGTLVTTSGTYPVTSSSPGTTLLSFTPTATVEMSDDDYWIAQVVYTISANDSFSIDVMGARLNVTRTSMGRF